MPKFKRKAKAKSLTPSQLNKVLKRCLIMSNPQLKRAVLVLSFSTLRVSELGQLTIDDLVFPNGEIKTEIALRAAICKRRKPRTIWLNEQTKKVLQEWFDYRNTKHWGTTFSSDYQGMNPKSIALLNQSGRSYSMKLKRRVNQSGENVDYLSCDSIEQLIRNIFARCGLNGASSHSGRRSYATNMNALGVELKAIQRALGHNSPDMTLSYIDILEKQLSLAAERAF